MNETIGQKLGCDELPFMESITAAYESDGNSIGSQTTLAVRGLKRALLELSGSKDACVRDQMNCIDSNFLWLDQVNYSDTNDSESPIGKKLTSQLSRFSRQQCVDFGYWYQDRLQQIEKQLAEDQNQLIEDTIDRSEVLIAAGLLPKSAKNLMLKSVDWAGALKPIGSVEQAANQYVGYCDDDGIGIANMYLLPMLPAEPSLEMKQTVFHEYVHGVGTMEGGRRGFIHGIRDYKPDWFERLLEEAYVSELSDHAVALDTKAEPKKMPEPKYPHERSFLSLVLAAADEAVTLADMGAAYFSVRRTDAVYRQHIASTLNETANQLFPEYQGHAWVRTNEQYEALQPRSAREKYAKFLAQTVRQRAARSTAWQS